MMGKYCRFSHPSTVSRKIGDSKLWVKLVKTREEAENLYLWNLGNGKVSFWFDHWCPSTWLTSNSQTMDPFLHVSDCWTENNWSIPMLNSILTEQSVSKICSIPFDQDKLDSVQWNVPPSTSLSKAIYHHCYHWSSVTWGAAIWNQFLSPSMSFFCWRTFLNLLPTDEILKRKGYFRPSMCPLCKQAEESIPHLFFQCKVSQLVWQSIIPNLTCDTTNCSWSSLHCWKDWLKLQLDSLPMIIAWFIWQARNLFVHHAKCTTAQIIAGNCMAFISKLIHHKQYPKILNNLEEVGSFSPKVTPLYWFPPQNPYIKVNTDGSFSLGEAGIGGVFRSHTGGCLLYYSSPIIAQDALEVELIAIYWALFIAYKVGWSPIWIESDSAMALQLIEDQHCSNWMHHFWIMKIISISHQLPVKFSFLFREGNKPANWLARLALTSSFVLVSSLPPPPLSFLLHGDSLGVPYLRLL